MRVCPSGGGRAGTGGAQRRTEVDSPELAGNRLPATDLHGKSIYMKLARW
jgi:hypothetical protein